MSQEPPPPQRWRKLYEALDEHALIASPVAQVGVRWTGVVAGSSRPVVVAPQTSQIACFRLAGSRLTLVAGNGRAGRSGDGGPAVGAAIGFPVEVAVGPRGGFGIVHDERWIRHVDATGMIRTLAEFQQPTALAYDESGNLFVSELLGGVQRRDATTGANRARSQSAPTARSISRNEIEAQ